MQFNQKPVPMIAIGDFLVVFIFLLFCYVFYISSLELTFRLDSWRK